MYDQLYMTSETRPGLVAKIAARPELFWPLLFLVFSLGACPVAMVVILTGN